MKNSFLKISILALFLSSCKEGVYEGRENLANMEGLNSLPSSKEIIEKITKLAKKESIQDITIKELLQNKELMNYLGALNLTIQIDSRSSILPSAELSVNEKKAEMLLEHFKKCDFENKNWFVSDTAIEGLTLTLPSLIERFMQPLQNNNSDNITFNYIFNLLNEAKDKIKSNVDSLTDCEKVPVNIDGRDGKYIPKVRWEKIAIRNESIKDSLKEIINAAKNLDEKMKIIDPKKGINSSLKSMIFLNVNVWLDFYNQLSSSSARREVFIF